MIRKVAAFAVLFGAGIGVLAWLDRNDGVDLGPGTRPAQVPAPNERDAAAGSTGLWGRQEFASYDPAQGGLESRLRAENSRLEDGGQQVLLDVSIDIFEPNTADRIASVVSERALVELEEIADEIVPRPSEQVELEDVTVDVRNGTRFAPLVLETTRLTASLAAQRFVTDEPVVARSNDVDLEGEGCTFDLPAGRLVFDRDGEATVRAGDGRTARLWSRGPLEVVRPPGVGARPVRVTASERARLGLSGDDGLALEANAVELLGSGDPEREGTFRFTGLVARGEVVLLARGNRFMCREALFTMSNTGAIESVRLSGAIVGELDPSTTQIEGLDDAELVRGLSRRVDLWGRGPMDLRLGPDSGFDLAGPAELEWDGTRLWAEGGLSGRPGSTEEPLQFEAWSGVRVERAGWTVRTERLSGRFQEPIEGEPTRIELLTDALAIAEGRDRTGTPVSLRARDGFELIVGERTWLVTRADGVDLTTGGARPLVASADRVTDFTMDDALGPRFTADEHVEVVLDGQVLRGQRLTVNGLDDLTVSSDTDRVLLDGPGLHVEAREVRRQGERLSAKGGATAFVERRGSRIDLEAESIEITGSIDAPADRPLRLRATGTVDAQVLQARGGTQMDIETQELEIVRQPVPGGELVQTVVRARDGVVAAVSGALGQHDLIARELDALVVGAPFVVTTDEGELEIAEDGEDVTTADDAAATPRRGSIEARGDVKVTSTAPTPMSGTGDTFSVDHEGRGVLLADPGRQVTAKGALPGDGQPFDVVGSSIEFDPVSLHIVEPRIEVGDPFAAARASDDTDGAGGAPVIVELIATCRRLDATADSVVFNGDVSFLGTTRTLQTWTLRCDRAELLSGVVRSLDEQGEPVERREPRELVATGDVRAVFSEGLEAEGDRLIARAFEQVVRIEGTPTRVRQRGLDFAATWFDIDLISLRPSAGPGWIGPSGTTPGDDEPR